MFVRDIMTRDVVSVRPMATLHEAAVLMLERRSDGLPVVDQDGHVLGVVGIKDILRAPWASAAARRVSHEDNLERKAAALKQTSVDAVMAYPALVIGEDRPAIEAVRIMVNLGRHPVPVVRDGRLVGVVSRADVMRAILAVPVEE